MRATENKIRAKLWIRDEQGWGHYVALKASNSHYLVKPQLCPGVSNQRKKKSSYSIALLSVKKK